MTKRTRTVYKSVPDIKVYGIIKKSMKDGKPTLTRPELVKLLKQEFGDNINPNGQSHYLRAVDFRRRITGLYPADFKGERKVGIERRFPDGVIRTYVARGDEALKFPMPKLVNLAKGGGGRGPTVYDTSEFDDLLGIVDDAMNESDMDEVDFDE